MLQDLTGVATHSLGLHGMLIGFSPHYWRKAWSILELIISIPAMMHRRMTQVIKPGDPLCMCNKAAHISWHWPRALLYNWLHHHASAHLCIKGLHLHHWQQHNR